MSTKRVLFLYYHTALRNPVKIVFDTCIQDECTEFSGFKYLHTFVFVITSHHHDHVVPALYAAIFPLVNFHPSPQLSHREKCPTYSLKLRKTILKQHHLLIRMKYRWYIYLREG